MHTCHLCCDVRLIVSNMQWGQANLDGGGYISTWIALAGRTNTPGECPVLRKALFDKDLRPVRGWIPRGNTGLTTPTGVRPQAAESVRPWNSGLNQPGRGKGESTSESASERRTMCCAQQLREDGRPQHGDTTAPRVPALRNHAPCISSPSCPGPGTSPRGAAMLASMNERCRRRA